MDKAKLDAIRDANKGKAAADLCLGELVSATEKFGQFASLHEGIAIIREEYLELEQAIFHGKSGDWFGEAIQLGAMAMRLLVDCEGFDEDVNYRERANHDDES